MEICCLSSSGTTHSRSGCEPAANSAQLAHSPQHLQRRSRRLVAQHCAGEPRSERLLAETLRTLQQQRVRQAIRRPCLAQLSRGVLVPRQQLRRRGSFVLGLGHGRMNRRISTSARIACCDALAIGGGIDDGEPARLAARALEVAVAHALEEIPPLLLEAVARAALGVARRRARRCRSRSAHRAAASDPDAARPARSARGSRSPRGARRGRRPGRRTSHR